MCLGRGSAADGEEAGNEGQVPDRAEAKIKRNEWERNCLADHCSAILSQGPAFRLLLEIVVEIASEISGGC